jgi:hypothetical protein
MMPSLSITSAAPESQTWCAIPVYNNAATIVDVARRTRAQLSKVLVVDDGSTDADLRELLKDVDVMVSRHPNNLGKGAAIATAFEAATRGDAKYLITLDGDGQHFPEDIPRFFPHLAPDTILIGRRHEITGSMPRSSLFGRDFSDFWIGVETGVVVHDTQSGFRAYPLRHIRDLKIHSRHYNFEMEIITRALWAGLKVGSVPIRVWYPQTSARVSSFHPVRDNARISLVHAKLVLRELLPIPHTRLVGADHNSEVSWLRGICSPMGLAAVTGLSALLGIVLWPWGPIAVLYIAGRLHLNKAAALFVIALTMLPAVPALALRLADHVVQPSATPHLRWFVGSHIVAFIIAPALTVLVYLLAKGRTKSA